MGKRLSPEQWTSIQRRYANGGESAKVLAREFRISESAIYKRSQRDWAALKTGLGRKTGDGIADRVSRLERVVERFEAVLERETRVE